MRNEGGKGERARRREKVIFRSLGLEEEIAQGFFFLLLLFGNCL